MAARALIILWMVWFGSVGCLYADDVGEMDWMVENAGKNGKLPFRETFAQNHVHLFQLGHSHCGGSQSIGWFDYLEKGFAHQICSQSNGNGELQEIFFWIECMQ